MAQNFATADEFINYINSLKTIDAVNDPTFQYPHFERILSKFTAKDVGRVMAATGAKNPPVDDTFRFIDTDSIFVNSSTFTQ